MADLFTWWQEDLTILPDGDLLTVSGTIEGEQRVIRRLLTNPGSYIWNLDYGAGLPKYVGSVADSDAIGALIVSQMTLESCVAQSPLPQVVVTPISNGINANIRYVDSTVDQLVTVGFNLDS